MESAVRELHFAEICLFVLSLRDFPCMLMSYNLSFVADYKCPGNKVYKSCGPTIVETCNAG